MSIDNSGILLIGQKDNDEHDARLIFHNKAQRHMAEQEDVSDFVYSNKGANAPKLHLDAWTWGTPCGYETSGLTGFYIESPSYDAIEVNLPAFLADVVTISREWKKYTGKQPGVFVLNLQS